MNDLALQFLAACEQSIQYRQPLLDELAASLNVQPNELYYQWVEHRWRHGSFGNCECGYYFHGYECDLRNTRDGRFLRVDFGPGGITTAFTVWGITQFVMTSKPPWREFAQLKSYLAEGQPPYNEHSGSLHRAGVLSDELEEEGLLVNAAPKLIELEKQFSSHNSEGIAVVQFPNWVSERQRLDMHVAYRNVVSEKGKSLLLTVARAL
jgi:hypothetical protein